jgi:serine/threonine-protein kinase
MSGLPQTVGRYEVVRQLGQGGMGKVLLAWDPSLERQVTVKLLTDIEDHEQRSRFTREARSAARLRHPNIVKIFDVGEDNGQPFIAMEYIQGHTLEQIIKRREPLTLVRKLQLMEEACAGLGYAHKSGIVHRDVKPANLMVDTEGVLQVLDFGVVHIAGSGMTQSGMLMGTFQYMSPEQLSGWTIDQRSDLFALGSVFYELLSGRQAFHGTFHDGLFNRILNEPPEPLDKLCPDLPAEVIAIVNRALEKVPDKRYAEAAAMRADIQHVRRTLEGAPSIDPNLTTPGTRENIQDYRDKAKEALNAGDYEKAVVAAEGVLNLRPEDSGADSILERARVALDKLQVNEWLEEAGQKLAQNDLSNAESLVEQALSVAPGSNRAIQLRALIDAARNKGDVPAQPSVAGVASTTASKPSRAALVGMAAAVVLAAIAGGVYMFQKGGPQETASAAQLQPSDPALPPVVTSVPAVVDAAPAAAPAPADPPRTDRAGALTSSPSPPQRAQPTAAAPPQATLQAAPSTPAPAPSTASASPGPDRLLAEARTAAASARRDADAAGGAAVASPSYKSALQLESEAARFVVDGRNDDAVRALWLAASFFKTAATTPAAPASPPPVAAPESRPAPVPESPAPPAAPAVADDEPAIRSVLRAYERAMSELDAEAVKRVYPAINAGDLTRAFGQLREQTVSIRNERIKVSGNTAVVICTVVQSFTPRVGVGRDTSGNAEFTMQKGAAGWVITARR